MLYSTASTHLLSAMLTRAAGRSTHALAQEWLAEPLGISIPPWPRDSFSKGIRYSALLRFAELQVKVTLLRSSPKRSLRDLQTRTGKMSPRDIDEGAYSWPVFPPALK